MAGWITITCALPRLSKLSRLTTMALLVASLATSDITLTLPFTSEVRWLTLASLTAFLLLLLCLFVVFFLLRLVRKFLIEFLQELT